jgi:hypothetical protein
MSSMQHQPPDKHDTEILTLLSAVRLLSVFCHLDFPLLSHGFCTPYHG